MCPSLNINKRSIFSTRSFTDTLTHLFCSLLYSSLDVGTMRSGSWLLTQCMEHVRLVRGLSIYCILSSGPKGAPRNIKQAVSCHGNSPAVNAQRVLKDSTPCWDASTQAPQLENSQTDSTYLLGGCTFFLNRGLA